MNILDGGSRFFQNWVDRIEFETVTMVEMSKITYLEEDRKFDPARR
jgi:hypothetical protein